MKSLVRTGLAGWIIGMLGLALALTVAMAAPIDLGESFPQVPLPAPLDPAQRAYLGLPEEQSFTLDQVKGRVVLVELLNVLCPHCRKQTGPYNSLYRMIENDPETRGKVKMLGVAVANSAEQIADFVEIYEVAFPVIADRRFTLHRAVRGGPTPFTIYVLRDGEGETGVVAGTHLGEDHDMGTLFDYLKELLTMQATEFASLAGGKTPPQPLLKPPQPEEEIVRRIKSSMTALGTGGEDLRKLDLPSGRQVYSAIIVRNGSRQPVFAEVASRSSICDVCHNVHFFYLFDRRGKVLAFEPLHLTKYGNEEWNEADLARFAKRVVGRPLDESWDFDSKIDAVTRATMTSAIIFDSLEQGRDLLEELRDKGLL